jgi:hypothetical protein
MRGQVGYGLMRGYLGAAIAACALGLGLAGCGQTPAGASADRAPGPDNGLARLLPPPGGLKRTAATQVLLRPGSAYEPALPHNRVAPLGAAAQYDALYSGGWDPLSNLAYAVYAFNLTDYAGPEELHLTWDSSAGFEHAWIGLANFSRGRWDWQAIPAASGGESLLALASGDYVLPATQDMYVAVAFTGATSWVLRQLHIGDVAQPEPWTHTWGGGEEEKIRTGVSDSQGNLYLAGTTASYDEDLRYALLVKYDRTGALQWSRTWGNQGDCDIYSLVVDAEDNVYAVGEGLMEDNLRTLLLLKLDPAGALVWRRIWGTNEITELARGAALDAQGNLYVVGDVLATEWNGGTPEIQMDLAVVAFNADGVQLWDRRWHSTTSGEETDGITAAPSGGCFVSLFTGPLSGPSNNREMVMAIDKLGNLVWAKSYKGGTYLKTRNISWNAGGRLLLAGEAGTATSHSNLALLMELNTSGAVTQSFTWDAGLVDGARNVVLGADGVMNLIGETQSFDGGGRTEGLLLRIAAGGTLLSAETYGQPDTSETLIAGGCWPDGWLWLCGEASQPAAVVTTPVTGDFSSGLAIAVADEPVTLEAWDGDMSTPALDFIDQAGTADAATGEDDNALALVRNY